MMDPYPHYRINLIDNTIFEPVNEQELPLHRPMYIIKAQKGVMNIPVYCESFSVARKEFGDATFDKTDSLYYSNSTKFLLESFKNCGAFVVRVADPEAAKSLFILECSKEEKDIIQFATDATTCTRLVYDSVDGVTPPAFNNPLTGVNYADGDFIPLWTNPAVPAVAEEVVAAGVELEWSSRTTFTSAETATTILPTTVGDKTTYPMMVFETTSAGAYGNRTGFSLYSDPSDNTADRFDAYGAATYRFKPVVKEDGGSLVDPVRDKTNGIFAKFVIRPDAKTKEGLKIDQKAVLQNNYADGYNLPYTITTYEGYFKTIGDICVAKEIAINPDTSATNERADVLQDGYFFNIISGRDHNNLRYDGTMFTDASIAMVDGTVNYLAEGDDGSLIEQSPATPGAWAAGVYAVDALVTYSDGLIYRCILATTTEEPTVDTANWVPFVTIEELRRNYLQTDIYPEIVDKARYPITHLFDAGYERDTKLEMLNFLDVRSDVKVVLGTHINNVPVLSEMDDESYGSILYNRALLMRESVLKGTSCCRATIFTQAGIMHDDVDEYTSAVLFSAVKKAEYQNKDFLDREVKGRPFNECHLFKEWSYVPYMEDAKSRKWDNGLNYCQYYDMNNQQYAAIRSVYPYASSVLVDDEVGDFCAVYLKHAVLVSWTIHVGLTKFFAVLKKMIVDDLSTRLNYIVNGKYNISVDAYQTEDERAVGYITHVQIVVTCPNTNRVWDVDVICENE